MEKMNTVSLSELAEKINAQLVGDGAGLITGINTIQDAGESEVCFLSSQKHARGLTDTKAAAVIVDNAMEGCRINQLVVDNVNRGLIAALEFFAPKLNPFQGIHPTAIIEPGSELDPTVVVGPRVYISQGVKIGAHTVIGPGCSIGENSTVGNHCRFDGNVVIYHNCHVGNNCIIQANSTIGSTGFGYSYIDGQHRLIPHNGGVILEDGVEIGANSCVDRAKFGNTLIGAGTKIDNFVQVAHNVQIGKQCLLVGGVGIAGSAKIGNGVIFAGHSGVADNKTVGDGAVICAKTAVISDVPAGQTVMGMPPQELQWELRCVSIFKRLPQLAKTVKELTQKVKNLEAAKNDKI